VAVTEDAPLVPPRDSSTRAVRAPSTWLVCTTRHHAYGPTGP
jgi:hypothetical protein